MKLSEFASVFLGSGVKVLPVENDPEKFELCAIHGDDVVRCGFYQFESEKAAMFWWDFNMLKVIGVLKEREENETK